jgi:hypothetical protein
MNTKDVKMDTTVKVTEATKNKVAKAVVGSKWSIGSFFDEAAKRFLKDFNKPCIKQPGQ